MGPLFGVIFPFIIFLIFRISKFKQVFLFRFFAGFCFVANGVYISYVQPEGSLDPAIMLANGTPKWVIILFGVIMVASGLFLWHGQRKHFGLAKEKGKIELSI